MGADSFVAAHLRAAADVARAASGAVFVPGGGDVPLLHASLAGLDQAGLDTVTVLWSTRRAELERGESLRVGPALVWPLQADGEIVALVYLEHAAAGFPGRADVAHGRLLAERIRVTAHPSQACASRGTRRSAPTSASSWM